MKNQKLSPLARTFIVTALVISFLGSGLGGADVAGASSVSTPNRTDELAVAANNTTINDVDKSWIYSGNWKVAKTKQTIGGQLHLSSQIGDSATIKISGSAFILIYSINKNFGKLAVYVDDTLVRTIDQNNVRFKHQREWSGPKLTPGTHTIRLVHVSGNEVSLDALRVREASTDSNPAPTTDPAVTQTPTSEVVDPTQSPIPNELPTLTQDASPAEIATLIPSSTPTTSTTQASTLTLVPTSTASSTPNPTATPVSTFTFTPAPSPTPTSVPTQAATLAAPIATSTATPTQEPASGFTSALSAAIPSSTLQSILDNMAAGSTLNVPAGNYSGSINIKKAGIVNFVGVTVFGQVTNSASNVTINNLTVRDATLVGFLTTGSNVTVNNLSVWDTDQGSTSDADGVRVRGSATFNNVYINLDNGTKTSSHSDCFQMETWVGALSGLTVNGGSCINRRTNASGQVLETSGFMIEKESTSWTNVTIRNMLIVAFRGINSSGGSNLTVENNTFISTCLPCVTPDTGRNSLGVYSGGNSGTLAFSRNIVLNFNAPVIVTGTKFTGSSNIVYCGTACRSDSGWSHTGQLWDVDPKLDANYIPLAGSPARLSNGYIGAFPPPTSPQVVPTSTATSAPTQPPTFTSPILTATSIATQAPTSTFTSVPTQVPTSTLIATATQTQATIVTSTPSRAIPSSTLQSILDNMAAGSTLNVPAGNYSGSINIKKAGIVNFVGVTVFGQVTNSASNVTINNLTVRDATLVGFLTTGSNVTVNNLSVWDTDQGSTSDADGVRVRGSATFNNVYINLDNGTKTSSHSDCFQMETWVGALSGLTVNGGSCINRRTNASGQVLETSGFMIEKESTSWTNVTIRNMLIVAFRGINSSGGSNLTVENNTFISTCLPCVTPDTGRNSLGVYSGGNSGTLAFSRNIVLNFNAPVIVTGTKFTGSSNIVYCGTACRSDSGWSHTGQLWDVDPKLDANYIPLAGSPAYLSNGHIGAFPRP